MKTGQENVKDNSKRVTIDERWEVSKSKSNRKKSIERQSEREERTETGFRNTAGNIHFITVGYENVDDSIARAAFCLSFFRNHDWPIAGYVHKNTYLRYGRLSSTI